MTTRNNALASLLAELGWSPRRLGQELNRAFGRGTVSVTAAYHWRDRGGIPRQPLPTYTAQVLARALNRPLEVDDVWPSKRVEQGGDVHQATEGLDGSWSFAATLEVANEWLVGGFVDRRRFLHVSGMALAQALAPYLTASTSTGSYVPTPDANVDVLVAEIQNLVPRLQLIDDEEGGAAGLDFVGNQLRSVLQVLKANASKTDTTRQLLVATADLAQLAGWKAIDAARPGLAQRYLLTGLRAARDAGYQSMEAHILADLAFQSASLGEGADGVLLGEAARDVAVRATAGVRASVLSRLAFAYAADGQPTSAEWTWLEAREVLTNKGLASEPEWMYYLTDNHLDCQAGYSMVMAGSRVEDTRQARQLFTRGEELLRTGAYARGMEDQHQRRALYEGTWLALSYTRHGKLDEAADVVELVIPRLDKVQSPRSVGMLTELAADLRRRQRNRRVADVLPELQGALSRLPSPTLV